MLPFSRRKPARHKQDRGRHVARNYPDAQASYVLVGPLPGDLQSPDSSRATIGPAVAAVNQNACETVTAITRVIWFGSTKTFVPSE